MTREAAAPVEGERCTQCDKPPRLGHPLGHFRVAGVWLPFCSVQCKHAYERRVPGTA
jgi:hypothetical protein